MSDNKKTLINRFFDWLSNLKCRSKCCSGSECYCGDRPVYGGGPNVPSLTSFSSQV